MSDVKSVIALLCKHLNLSIGASFKPEYFRLAKYDKGGEDVIQALWTALHILSRYAVRDEEMCADFDRYDDPHATKLYFALLQYPAMNFYALSGQNTSCSRELLLALGWLVAAKNALNLAVREAIANSVLGQEYSSTEDNTAIGPSVGAQENRESRGSPADEKSRMRGIVFSCGRVSHNIKGIAELAREKIRLTTKIHAASLNTSGLPHLSVSQAALAKKMHNKKDFTKKDEETLEDLRSASAVLEIHGQWVKVEHVFYDWMTTVIDESKSDEDSEVAEDRRGELWNFLSLLRHATKKKLHSTTTGENSLYERSCGSRLLRTAAENTEAELWSAKTAEKLIAIEADVGAKLSELTSELRRMVRSIANCAEI